MQSYPGAAGTSNFSRSICGVECAVSAPRGPRDLRRATTPAQRRRCFPLTPSQRRDDAPAPRAILKAGVPWFAGLAMLLVGAGLTASPALAKCRSDCKKHIVAEAKACKSGCCKDKVCKKACRDEKKSDKAACTAATNPMPPSCGECGGFLTKWGSAGSGDGQFSGDDGIAVDGSGNVFVTDLFNNRIQKFTNSGPFLIKWGSGGSEDGQFTAPIGVAVDVSGDVFV